VKCHVAENCGNVNLHFFTVNYMMTCSFFTCCKCTSIVVLLVWYFQCSPHV